MSCFTEHAAPTNPCPVCGYNEQAQEFPPHILRPRTILHGKYLLGKVLGQGGFGITYIGWDLNLGIKVAVKEYYPSGFVSRETTSAGNATVQPFTGSQGDYFVKGREKFINEARTLAKFFTLPGIVSIKDFFQENGTAYISMEYIEGQTLKDYLSQMGGRLPAGQIFDMMKPVMYSLAEVHNAGLIHRDISPDNIMISKEGQMKLLDFGAARDFSDSGNKSMSIMLKPGFAPEEQYRSRGVQGPWTDVYALSATIYKCITGITPEESVERTRRDDVRPPSMLGIPIDPAQEAALMRGMAVLQEHRFQNVSELYASLYGAQTGTTTGAYATAQPAAATPTTTSSQYTQQQPSQHMYQQPSQTQYQQPQYQQPQHSAQTPPKKTGFAGWSTKRKVASIIGGTAILLLIILLALPSEDPANTNVHPPGVTSPPRPVDPEPSPAQVSLDGTWISRVQDGYTTEFAFNDASNRFYLVHMDSQEDDPDSFSIVEGTFYISGDNISLTSEWGAEAYSGYFFAVEADNEHLNITFSLSEQTLTLFDEDGLPEVFTGGQTLGLWSFNHRNTVAFTELVEDMPFTMVTFYWSIPGYYTGFWSNGMPNGFGMFTNGESSDTGEYHFNEGAFAIGTFVNGLIEGFAEYTCPTSGDTFEGHYVNSQRSGFGIYTWGNGDVYEGYFGIGLFNGEGTITYYEDGYSFKAFWIDNEPVGNVVITFDDGRVFDGVVEDGVLGPLTER